MLSSASVQLAAQAWCTQTTSHKEMDTELAFAFAHIIEDLVKTIEGLRQKTKVHIEGAIGELHFGEHCEQNLYFYASSNIKPNSSFFLYERERPAYTEGVHIEDAIEKTPPSIQAPLIQAPSMWDVIQSDIFAGDSLPEGTYPIDVIDYRTPDSTGVVIV